MCTKYFPSSAVFRNTHLHLLAFSARWRADIQNAQTDLSSELLLSKRSQSSFTLCTVRFLPQIKLELILHQDKTFSGESICELETPGKMNAAASPDIPKSSKGVKMKKKVTDNSQQLTLKGAHVEWWKCLEGRLPKGEKCCLTAELSEMTCLCLNSRFSSVLFTQACL